MNIAKTYVTVTDPFEGVNIGFGELQSQHMEYGVAKMDGDNHIEGDPLHLHKGENKLSLAEFMFSAGLCCRRRSCQILQALRRYQVVQHADFSIVFQPPQLGHV